MIGYLRIPTHKMPQEPSRRSFGTGVFEKNAHRPSYAFVFSPPFPPWSMLTQWRLRECKHFRNKRPLFNAVRQLRGSSTLKWRGGGRHHDEVAINTDGRFFRKHRTQMRRSILHTTLVDSCAHKSFSADFWSFAISRAVAHQNAVSLVGSRVGKDGYVGGRRQNTASNTCEVGELADCPWSRTTEPHHNSPCLAGNYTQAWPQGDEGQETQINSPAVAAVKRCTEAAYSESEV